MSITDVRYADEQSIESALDHCGWKRQGRQWLWPQRKHRAVLKELGEHADWQHFELKADGLKAYSNNARVLVDNANLYGPVKLVAQSRRSTIYRADVPSDFTGSFLETADFTDSLSLADPRLAWARALATSVSGDLESESLAMIGHEALVEQIGAPKPIADEILDRVRQFVEHPDWVKAMQVRQRCSYLFIGCTGSGKSYHLKYITSQVHDLVEQYTGERSSRVVMVDASQFWTPYFGETEQRIARRAEKLQSLGSRKLRSATGSEVTIPLIVVLEECEALLRARGEMQGSGHLFDRPLALLLQKTESLESALEVPIIWIATSNRADLVDAAALRRLGMRQSTFGTLRASEALAVLKKKSPLICQSTPYPSWARRCFRKCSRTSTARNRSRPLRRCTSRAASSAL